LRRRFLAALLLAGRSLSLVMAFLGTRPQPQAMAAGALPQVIAESARQHV